MADHPNHVEGFNGSLEDLAKAVGKMSYDKVGEFIKLLADDLKEQMTNDFRAGRTDLAGSLGMVAGGLYEAHRAMENVWEICEPHMRD